jgi:hypothetical protein
MNFHDALKQLQSQGSPFAAGSSEEAAAVARFKRFFADFSPNKIQNLLDETYAEDAWFNDTLKTIHGRENLRSYLRHSAEAVDACTVQVDDVTRTDNADYLIRWRMMIQFKRFKRGVQTHSIGISLIRFNAQGLVALHQDFWDAAGALFEHVPILGFGIRKLKQRL